MSNSDPVEDYARAIEDLANLQQAVAGQQHQQTVLDAMTRLRLAVVRAYGGARPRHPRGSGARTLILLYLQEHVGEWVYGEELAAVSGIGEWARRVRELRVEQGYEIEEDGGRYRLTSRDADSARRARWTIVGEIQERGGPARGRVLMLLQRLAGTVVDVDELDRVAGGKFGARLVRQLRNDDGYPIEAQVDAPDLHAGEFRLSTDSSAFLLDEGQRAFGEEIRAALFARDRYRCIRCRRDRFDAIREGSSPFFLLVRHMDAQGADILSLTIERAGDLSRLQTLCVGCALGLTDQSV
jgi:hypothetical protein